MDSKMENKLDLIVVIVNRGFADEAMDAARDAGATGGTVLLTRGTGDSDMAFYGITIHPERELLMILAAEEKRRDIMRAVVERVGLKSPGKGVTFSLPVSGAIGLSGYNPDADD